MKWFLEYAFNWLMVCYDSYVLSVYIVSEFVAGKYNGEHFFFFLRVSLLGIC